MDINDLAITIEELQKNVADLRAQNEDYRRLASFPHMNPRPVLEFDLHGEVVYLNPAAQQVLARLRKSDARLFLPEDFAEICNVAKKGEVFSVTREARIDDHIFDESINFNLDYSSLRIYVTEVTEHRQADEALLQSRRELTRMQELVESITRGTDVIIAAVDINYRYTYFNQAYKDEMLRLSGKEIYLGMDMLSAFAHLPDQQKIIKQEWDPVLQGESMNKTIKFGDPGTYQSYYYVLHAPLWDADGNVVGAGEVAYNVTEQVRTQEALRASEARFRMALKNSPVTVAAQDKDLRFIWAYNQRTVDPAEVIGKTDTDLFPPEVAAWSLGLKRKVLETGMELHEQGWIISGGKRLFLDLFLEPLRDDEGNITGVGIATVDLTGIKQTEQALRESEERYRSLFEGMTEGFAIHEMIFDAAGNPYDYRFLDLNPAFEQLTGLKRELVVGKTVRQMLPAESDLWVAQYGNVVMTGEPIQIEQYSPALNRHYQIFAYKCAPDQFAVIFLDITEHKRIENELRINLTKYTELFNSLPLGVTVSDKTGKIIESNEEAEKLLGLSKQEHVNRSIDGAEWRIIRPDKTPMPAEEFASVRALKEQQRVEGVEMGIVKGDDPITWISVTASPLPLEGHGIIIVYNDITKRVEAEDALRQAHEELELTVQKRTEELLQANTELKAEIKERQRVESELLLQSKQVDAQRQRFNDVLEILPAYLILLTPDYHVAFANRYFRERFGEDQGRHCYEYLFDRYQPCENCETYKVLETGANHHWEWIGPDECNYDVFDFPFTDVDGSILILEMGIDITGRKQAEGKLRQLNAYNRSLIEASLDALVTITTDGKIGDVNAVTESLTGYQREELIDTDFHSYFTDPEKARAVYAQVLDAGSVRDLELEIKNKDGHITPVFYNASIYLDVSGKMAGVLVAAHDITERKRSEMQLIILTTALEAAANGIMLADQDGNILWTNTAFNQMTGYTKEEIVGKNPRLLKSGKQDRNFYQHLWETIVTGKVWRGELVNRRKDGSLYYEEQTITPVFDEKGKITNFISIRQDISEHKQAEEALRRSEEQYRSLTIATTQIVWQTNTQGEVIEDIPMWGAFTGQTKQQILGLGWINALHPDDRKQTEEIWAHAVETQTPYDTEYRIRSRSGDYDYFAVRGVPVRNTDGSISGWIGTCTNITDKKNYEKQLVDSEKHAAIGRMVGSVTHEINNPLQTIKNCLYLIKQDTVPGSPNDEPLEMALSETQRLSNIVGQLRQLYRPQAAQIMTSYDLLAIIDEVHSLVIPHLKNNQVTWQPLSGLRNCQVDCIKDQIIEVLLNISLNAIEAMQLEGGVLSVNMVFSDGQVGVVIGDTGPGIRPDILPRIFEPFITTKEFGLGLGLSISYGIIQKHGGQITVDSQPGQGTRFTIWLPVIG